MVNLSKGLKYTRKLVKRSLGPQGKKKRKKSNKTVRAKWKDFRSKKKTQKKEGEDRHVCGKGCDPLQCKGREKTNLITVKDGCGSTFRKGKRSRGF